MSYDNPAYQAVFAVNLGLTTAGASAIAPTRFVAFTSTLVKSISTVTTTSGTSTTHIMRSLVFRNGGTSTETNVLFTLGSASLSTGVGYAAISTLTLSQGDILTVLQGSDATMVSASTAELVILPGAGVSP